MTQTTVCSSSGRGDDDTTVPLQKLTFLFCLVDVAILVSDHLPVDIHELGDGTLLKPLESLGLPVCIEPGSCASGSIAGGRIAQKKIRAV